MCLACRQSCWQRKENKERPGRGAGGLLHQLYTWIPCHWLHETPSSLR